MITPPRNLVQLLYRKCAGKLSVSNKFTVGEETSVATEIITCAATHLYYTGGSEKE